MSENVKPARVVIGGPAGCVGFTQEESRVLNEILHSGTSLRNTVVHRALRIMCQAVIQSPQSGYPGTLSELEKQLGVFPATPAPGAGVDVEGAPDWLVGGSEPSPAAQPEPSPSAQVETPPKAEIGQVSGDRVPNRVDTDAAQEQEPKRSSDPERDRAREAASAFIG